MGHLLKELGLEESVDKATQPSTSMTYLGIKFDTVNVCLHVDDEKIVELKTLLSKWSLKTVAKKHELQSILGKLIFQKPYGLAECLLLELYLKLESCQASPLKPR